MTQSELEKYLWGASPDGVQVLPEGINLKNMIQKNENEDS